MKMDFLAKKKRYREKWSREKLNFLGKVERERIQEVESFGSVISECVPCKAAATGKRVCLEKMVMLITAFCIKPRKKKNGFYV